MVLGGSEWFSILFCSSQLFSMLLVVLNGYSSSQLVPVVVRDSQLFSMITGGYQWIPVILSSIQRFWVVVNVYQLFSVVVLSGSLLF